MITRLFALQLVLFGMVATSFGCNLEISSEESSEKKTAADGKSDNPKGNEPSGDAGDSNPAQDDGLPEPILFDAELVSIDYDKDTDEIVLEIRHSICSQTFMPKLVIADACGESYPLSCSGSIQSEQPFEQTCENIAPSTIELRASIEAVPKPANFSIVGKTKPIGSILVE